MRPKGGKGRFEAISEPLAQRVAAGVQKIGLVMKRRVWQSVGKRGVLPLQGQVLSLLRMQQNRCATVSSLAQELAVKVPTVSDAVKTLEHKGLVKRSRSRKDNRVVHHVQLSARGVRQGSIGAGWPDFLAAAADQLSPSEQVSLLRALIKMIRTLQTRGEIPIARMCVSCRYFQPNVYSDPERPRHCDYVDAPFGARRLRINCAEHKPAAKAQADRIWKVFTSGKR
jgi:DNA-binding MarR family transcriptional regulator